MKELIFALVVEYMVESPHLLDNSVACLVIDGILVVVSRTKSMEKEIVFL